MRKEGNCRVGKGKEGKKANQENNILVFRKNSKVKDLRLARLVKIKLD